MLKCFYDVGRGRLGRREFARQDQLLSNLKDANVGIQRAVDCVNLWLTSENANTFSESLTIDMLTSAGLPISTSTEKSWIEDGRLTIQYLPVSNTDSIKNATRLKDKLSIFLEINKDFTSKLDRGVVAVGDVFIREFNGSLLLCTVFDGINCPQCEAPVRVAELNQHMLEYMCPIAKGQKEVEKAGYLKVLGHERVSAIRRAANIPSLMVPERYGIYAPQWVHDAITTYEREGYAGLTIEEFLSKVSGSGT